MLAFDSSIDDELGSEQYLNDPYPLYRRLRDEAPVYWSERFGFWVVSRYEDTYAALRDNGTFFSLRGTVAAKIATLSPADQRALRPLEEHYSAGLMHSDPPDHTRLRGLISGVFTPRVIEALRDHIGAVVDRFLDVLAAKRTFDLVEEFAFPLPATVLCSVLGLEEAERARFKEWSDEIARFIGTGRASSSEAFRAQEALGRARAHVDHLAEARRAEPRDDLISRLVGASDQDLLTPGEMLSTCVTFLVGGHETTTALISSAILLLGLHPEQRRLATEDPSLIPGLVEETLRYEPPTQRATRRIAANVELAGSVLKKGQTAMLMLGAANRDPERFADPDRFDVTRDANRHLAFGMGPHFCMGAPLARLETQIAVERLLVRFPDLSVTVERPDWIGNFNFRQLHSLPAAL